VLLPEHVHFANVVSSIREDVQATAEAGDGQAAPDLDTIAASGDPFGIEASPIGF
jgi:hypothetical protein